MGISTHTRSKTQGGNDGSSGNGGFTIIETLVAIAVLMIAIAGPLSIASKSLTTALYAHDQTIASFLAQESMEIIKNARDNNVSKVTSGGAGSWLNSAYDFSTDCSDDTDWCDASAVSADRFSMCEQVLNNGLGCPLFSTQNGYSHDTSSSQSIFSRYYYLTGANGTGPCIATDSECRVTVVVNWKEGIVPESIALSSQLTDTSF